MGPVALTACYDRYHFSGSTPTGQLMYPYRRMYVLKAIYIYIYIYIMRVVFSFRTDMVKKRACKKSLKKGKGKPCGGYGGYGGYGGSGGYPC